MTRLGVRRSPAGRLSLVLLVLAAEVAIETVIAVTNEATNATTNVAFAEPVPVRVLEVAGDVAYLDAGRAAGVVPGTKISLHQRTLVVVAVTERTAAVTAERGALAIGEAGTAEVTREAVAVSQARAIPRPSSAFVGQWSAPVLPASTQDPRRVSLGAGGTPGRSHLTFIGRGFGTSELALTDADRAGDAEGRVIASFELMTERPLALDVDVAGRIFSDGANRHTRTPVMVRAAQLRYGSSAAPQFALGRLRYAASSLGALDGGRASLQLGSLGVAAFGGIVPEAQSGKPDPRAARFGAEVSYDAITSPWQPRVALTAHGSTWEGALDERRLAAVASASHGSTWVDGWAEAQSFASDNPWGASALELAGAGATAQWRKDGRQLGVDLGYQRPERSQRLAAELPLEWLCTPTAAVGDTATTCAGGDWWASATLSAGLHRPRWAIDAVGSLTRTHGVARSLDRSAYLRGEVQVHRGRLEAGAGAGKTSFASWNSGELGAAYVPHRRLELAARYRPELLDYVASTGPVLLHSAIAEAHYELSPALDLSGSALATVGSDHNALAVLFVVVWRPLP